MKHSTIGRFSAFFSSLLTFLVLLSACGGGTSSGSTSGTNSGGSSTTTWAAQRVPAGKKIKIGFLYVGPRNDFGYNYAADQGRLYLEKTLPNVETVYAENVPENADAERVMEQMIRNGATIIFPTSYGHLAPAMNVALRHKDIVFLHQGGLKNTPNVGTYFGEIWQSVYLAGIVAGKTTKTNKLGFVAAHPIPQVMLNINAFTLGAQSVNPKVTTTVVFSGDWCNPAKQAEAANSLLDQGIDVVSQHEDCPIPVIQATQRHNAFSVGYHADASPVAGDNWLTAGIWSWGPLYVDLVKQVLDGTWKSSLLRGGLKEGYVTLAPFGPHVSADVQKLALTTKQGIISGTVFPFQGPIKDQSGAVRFAAGERPSTTKLETTDWLVAGVIGTIPK